MADFSCLTDQALMALFDEVCEYNAGLCGEICDRAGMSEDWEGADSENFEEVLRNAIDRLKSSFAAFHSDC